MTTAPDDLDQYYPRVIHNTRPTHLQLNEMQVNHLAEMVPIDGKGDGQRE